MIEGRDDDAVNNHSFSCLLTATSFSAFYVLTCNQNKSLSTMTFCTFYVYRFTFTLVTTGCNEIHSNIVDYFCWIKIDSVQDPFFHLCNCCLWLASCSSANHAESIKNLTVGCDNWRLGFDFWTFDTWHLSNKIFRSDSGAVYFIKFPSEFVKGASAKSFVIIVLRDTQTVLIGHMCFVKSSVKYILLETSKLVMDFCMRFSRF